MLRLLVILVVFAAASAWGQITPPDVTAAQLDAAVDNVTATLPEEDPQRISLLKYYADTRAALVSFEQFKESFNSYTLSRANAEEQAESIRTDLASAQSKPEQDDKVLLTASLQELEQMLQRDKAELDARNGRLADTRAAIDLIPLRPAEIRARVAELVMQISKQESELALMDKTQEAGSESEARLWFVQAQLASAKAEKAALDEELLSQPMRLNLLKAQLDQTSHEIAVLEKRSLKISTRAGELRQGEAAQANIEAEKAVADTQGKHELVQRLADKNAELTRSFSVRSESIEIVRGREAAVRSRADQLASGLDSITRKLEILGMSTAVGEILREQQVQLPSRRELARQVAVNTEGIALSSARQLELEEERRQLRNPAAYVAGQVEGLAPATVALIEPDLLELVAKRRELMRQAVELDNTYAQVLGDLDFSLRRYQLAVNDYGDFISERLLWIPSRETLSLFQAAILRNQITETFAPGRWLMVLQALPGELLSQPLTGVIILLVLLLVYFNPRLHKQLVATGKKVGYVRSDQFSSTIQAIGLSLLLSLKWPLLLVVFAWLFEVQDSELAAALYVVSVRTTFYLFGLEFMRIVVLPGGLVDAHFRWPANRVSAIRRRIVSLEHTFLPAAFLVGFFLNLYPREVGGPLGALAVICVLASIAHYFRLMPVFVQEKMQTMLRDDASAGNNFWGRLLRLLLYWIPVVSMLAVLLGYTYTAIEFALLLVETMVLFFAVLMFHELGLRWLHLTRRRMAFKMRQEHARAEKAAPDDSETSVEDELLENDPTLLSEEGTKLLNFFTLIGGLLGVALIWAEVFPALGILDSVELWHQTGVVDGQEVPVPVTLANLVGAVAISIVGWAALRRIPSLLEIFLRQRAKVRPASAYAVTRVLQYAGTTLLVIFVMGSLGGSWSSMQWAVAALSLGIGFGLQEIVANFISGLIILFEQPIRLGDIVTVGEVSGTVTKIQMRATTIRDFDRRELLVPNKEFITNQLLNWSLSDPVTRRLVQVGVAYGSDMNKAMDIVGDVVKSHPIVLTDPESTITFDEFGDNSLLISVRFFIDQLDQRLRVDSDLRMEINRRFNAAGIVVAFPQRDVHLDAGQPLEIKLVDKD